MKAEIKKLIELIEHNTWSMWDSNLGDTTECIILENKELQDMIYEDEAEDKDFVNHKFNGEDISNLITELKKQLNTK